MKNILLLISTFLFIFHINAQDTITLNNGKVIHAYITERCDTKIRYTHDTIGADTTYDLNLNRIRKIQYDNGDVDLLGSQNPRNKFPLGINVGLATFPVYIPFMPIVSIDYYFLSNISAEVDFINMRPFSYDSSYLLSIGGKYWFANNYSKSGFSPFAGLSYTRLWFRTDEDLYLSGLKPEWTGLNLAEVPIGISYINKFGLQTSLQYDILLNYMSNPFYIVGGLIEFRIGWRFKTGKKGY